MSEAEDHRKRLSPARAAALFALTLLAAGSAFYHAPSPDLLGMAAWATSRQGRGV